MIEIGIKSIELHEEYQTGKREVVIHMKSGSEIHIVPCYESFEQYGGLYDELCHTEPIAEKYNGWLHGGHGCDDELPDDWRECEGEFD